MQVDELLPFLRENQETLIQEIRGGNYKPLSLIHIYGGYDTLFIPLEMLSKIVPIDNLNYQFIDVYKRQL